jgi:hypothetical protein
MMTDPDFVRGFQVMRPTLSVANEGEASYSYDTLEMKGIVQPASPRDIQMLPEGSRLKDVISVWCGKPIRGGNGNDKEADVLIIGVRRYRVIKAEPWPDNGYYRVFAEGFVA